MCPRFGLQDGALQTAHSIDDGEHARVVQKFRGDSGAGWPLRIPTDLYKAGCPKRMNIIADFLISAASSPYRDPPGGNQANTLRTSSDQVRHHTARVATWCLKPDCGKKVAPRARFGGQLPASWKLERLLDAVFLVPIRLMFVRVVDILIFQCANVTNRRKMLPSVGNSILFFPAAHTQPGAAHSRD